MLHVGTTVRPGENINFSLDEKGDMYINAVGGGGESCLSQETLERISAKLEWESAELGKEYWTGKYWHDGRKIYGRRLNLNVVKNTTEQVFSHSIPNINTFVNVMAIARDAASTNSYNIPYANSNFTAAIYANATNIFVRYAATGQDVTFFAKIEYTCTNK